MLKLVRLDETNFFYTEHSLLCTHACKAYYCVEKTLLFCAKNLENVVKIVSIAKEVLVVFLPYENLDSCHLIFLVQYKQFDVTACLFRSTQQVLKLLFGKKSKMNLKIFIFVVKIWQREYY